MTRFCGNCGAPLDDDALVCGQCGTPIDGDPIDRTRRGAGAKSKNHVRAIKILVIIEI